MSVVLIGYFGTRIRHVRGYEDDWGGCTSDSDVHESHVVRLNPVEREGYFLSRASLIPQVLRDCFADRPNVHSFIDNTGWLMLDKFVRLALGITVGAWVARYLGPGQYGELTYSIALVALFQAAANLGADGIIIRDIVKRPEDAPGILGTAFWLRVLFGVFSWGIVLGTLAILRPKDKMALLITAIVGSVLVFQAVDTIDLWFQSQNQNRRTVIPKLLAYIFTNGVKVILILIHASLILFASAILLDVIIAAIGLCISYNNFPISGGWRFRFHLAGDLLKQSFPFLLSGLAIMIYMRIDQIMIREMVSDKELGIYSAGMALSSFWGFIPLTLSIALGPYVARKKNESEQAYYDALETIFRIFGALSVVVVVLVMFFGSFAIDLLYGQAYAGSKHILSIHIFTFIFISLGIAQNLWIVNERAGRIGLYKTIIGLIACIIGNIFLIPIYGAIGAAIVAVLVQFLSAVGSNIIFSHRVLKMQLLAIVLFPLMKRWLFRVPRG